MTPLPDDVQRVARAMLKDFESIMAEVTNRVWMQVPAYSDTLPQRDELGDRVQENILNVIVCLLEDRPPSRTELDRSRENGERRALQGVSEAAIIQSFRNAERTLIEVFSTWCARMQVKPANARLGQQEMIGHLDALEGAMTESFTAMRKQISNNNVLTEPDLVNRLVSGKPISPTELEHLAGLFGLRDVQQTRFVGVCAVMAGAPDERLLVRVRHHLVSQLQAATGMPILSGTVLTDHGLHAAVFTLPWTDDVALLARTMEAAIAERQIGIAIRAALGDATTGLAQAGSSCRQAIAALEVGLAVDEARTAIVYSDVLLEVLAMRDPVITRQLHERYIGPLAAHDFLEETLRVHLDTDQSIAETAARLRVHKNTVVYRIRRIQELTGLDLHTVRDIARATLAIEGTRLGIVDGPTPG